ncbi:MAG: TniQ family protein [Burkholderiales bacterium]|nr:TniQ family protein [Burkholderiales bacterium]
MRLPHAYPDELIGSIFIRGAIHTGLPPKRLLMRALGRERSHQSMFIPTGLDALTEVTSQTPSQLLWEHTAFPYAVAFMSPEQVAMHEAKALSAGDAGRISLGALARSATQGVARLRFCPDCAKEDVAAYGESYWRRTHCLPAVHLCVKHAAQLHSCPWQPRTLSQQLNLPLPHELSIFARSRSGISVGKRLRVAATSLQGQLEPTSCPPNLKYHLAASTGELLSESWRHQFDWFHAYRDEALRLGYVKSSQIVAGARLAHDMRTLFGTPYLQELNCAFEGCCQVWPGAMVRSVASATFSPVKHLLLRALFQYAPEIAQASPFHYKKPGKKVRDYDTLDASLASVVHRETERLLLLRRVTSTQSLLRDMGQWEMFRHARGKLPLTEAAVQAFKASDASARKSGGREAHANRMRAIAEGRQKRPKSWAERELSGMNNRGDDS